MILNNRLRRQKKKKYEYKWMAKTVLESKEVKKKVKVGKHGISSRPKTLVLKQAKEEVLKNQ